jgi:Mn2+/Fe2+ NRAMP family transporter
VLRRLGSVLFWSVIAAAFIGPGTVTTAASAGARYGYALLWALLFSTVACLALQEAAARLTVVSGLDLGQALSRQYPAGIGRIVVLTLALGAVVLGCAAYQAGNLLGGAAGAALGTGLPEATLIALTGLIAAGLLLAGSARTVARSLSLLVAVMGVAFLVTAWGLAPPPGELLRGSLVPARPPGSGLLLLGLIGTTVVPYNLFLGSGLARNQPLVELRFGLFVAILLGGIISMAIVVVGAAVVGSFSFEALAGVLGQRLGAWARSLFALGLFAAGLSSAITAPLAAAITTRSFLDRNGDARWRDRGRLFRTVWLTVLLVGVGFSMSGVKPIPAILIAQALNGVLLPCVAVFLLLAVNDRQLMGRDGLNRAPANLLLVGVVAVTLVLGATNVAKAATAALGLPALGERPLLAAAAAFALVLAWPVGRRLARRRRAQESPRPVTR